MQCCRIAVLLLLRPASLTFLSKISSCVLRMIMELLMKTALCSMKADSFMSLMLWIFALSQTNLGHFCCECRICSCCRCCFISRCGSSPNLRCTHPAKQKWVALISVFLIRSLPLSHLCFSVISIILSLFLLLLLHSFCLAVWIGPRVKGYLADPVSQLLHAGQSVESLLFVPLHPPFSKWEERVS